MAELVTGLEMTADHVESLLESAFHQAPSQRYADDLES